MNGKTELQFNPFFKRKNEIRFDKVYSEKDFLFDCEKLRYLRVQRKLLSDDQIELVANFWVNQLKPENRNIRKVAEETFKYMTFLRKGSRIDVQK